MEQFAANVTGEDQGVLDEGRPLLFDAFLRFEKELPITNSNKVPCKVLISGESKPKVLKGCVTIPLAKTQLYVLISFAYNYVCSTRVEKKIPRPTFGLQFSSIN